MKSLQIISAVFFTTIVAQSSLVRSNPIVSNSIVSDGTLPNPTIVKENLITGGTQSGRNLFHSFDRFSVPVGQVAKFQPDSGIQNIITRVTGLKASVIDGEIQAPGNFFLINPNGITFGAESTLNIGGSFFATTAPVLKFSDGKTFGSDRSTVAPVLSVNVPIGVQWGLQASGAIRNFGNLSVPETLTLIAPTMTFEQATATGRSVEIQAPTQLSLNQSQITTSNGGTINIQVGDLTANSSLIDSSYITNPVTNPVTNLAFNQPAKLTIQGTGNLVFDRLSSVEAKTFPTVTNPGNPIEISGRSIVLRNGSAVKTYSLGEGNAGTITLNASDRIALLDSRSGILPSTTTISSSTFLGDNTRSGNISLTAPEITIANQALVQSTAVTSSQRTGDIRIAASRSIEVDNSIVSNLDFSDQVAGALTLQAPTVRIVNGSWIEANVFNNVRGSNISILANDRLIISGKGTAITTQTSGNGRGGDVYLHGNQIEVSEGAIVRTDTSGSGSGGNLSVLGQDIQIIEGGQLRSVSSGNGDSGNVQVNASDRILIKGQDVYDPVSRFLIFSFNTSSASIRYIPPSELPPNADQRGILLLNNPIYSPEAVVIPVSLNIALNDKYTGIKASSYGRGKAGNIDLQAPLIDVRFFSLISNVSTDLGDSAKISIQAKTVNLNNSTILSSTIRSKNGGDIKIDADTINGKYVSILASAIQGDGGLITLNVRDRLTLSDNSSITARSANLGKGGIIRINNDNGFIIAEANGNNDILATASQGQGGLVLIRSAGIFNIVPRPNQTLSNDLLASSETGIQGSITLNLTQPLFNSTLPKLSELILDRSRDIVPSCPSLVRENRLIITGQGGRTPTSSEMLNLLSLEAMPSKIMPSKVMPSKVMPSKAIASSSESVLIEATHWERQADGTLVLLPSTMASMIASDPTRLASCAKSQIPD